MITTRLDGQDLVELPLTPTITNGRPAMSRFIAISALPPTASPSPEPDLWGELPAERTDLYVYDTQTRTLAQVFRSTDGEEGPITCFPGRGGWRSGDVVQWSTDPSTTTPEDGVNLKAI
jgi:hypothetical protein